MTGRSRNGPSFDCDLAETLQRECPVIRQVEMDLEIVKLHEWASFRIRHLVELDEGMPLARGEDGGTVTIGPAAEKEWHGLTLHGRGVWA